MVTPLGIVLVIFGALVCFMGYSVFSSMLPLWGFILGGFIAISLTPLAIHVTPEQTWILQTASFIVGGLIGAFIATPLYYVTIFASGAAMGGLIGIILGAYLVVSRGQVTIRALTELAAMSFPPKIDTPLKVIMMVVLGLIVGGFSISFQKFMIIASTAFLGSAGVVSGLTGAILDALRASPTKGVLVMVSWLLLGMIGMFVQFRMRDET